ncbi:MAG: UvrD-helicase domain-containing protein [Verrucomicrobia bacterium]|nr:UvrD-helicase domain-containing protein [Verrucomicrobiota bacterium]
MAREFVLDPFRAEVNLQIDYARELNAQQHAAVTATPGPALVIAGAGSGKTRTLTYRVAFLLEQGVPADRILLLTFTNKSAREMMRRVVEILGHDLASLWGGTFHSIGNRILRQHADRLGFRRDFTILDRDDAKDLLQAALDDSGIDVTATRLPKPDVIGDVFSMAANTGHTIARTLQENHPQFEDLALIMEDLRTRFIARKRAANVMDFDDLLGLWLRLLKEHEDIRDIYQRRFQFILVDEYQDTNELQGELIDLLAARHRNVMVVGDDAQSIYSWRGANFQNILEFPKRYAGARVYKIETNYRSTPEILDVASKSGPKPVLAVCGDASEQAAFIAQRALQLRDEGINLNDMAVLYRSHFHAMELQFELTRRNIPFSITSGLRFFEQAHIKDVAAFLKFAANPADEISFKRMVRLLPGVGGKGADKLWNLFRTHHSQLPEGAPNPLASALQSCNPSVAKKTTVAWAQFSSTIAQLEGPTVRGKAAEMIRITLEGLYEDYLQETFANASQRLEEIIQLTHFSQQFTALDEFLTQLALLSNVEAEEQNATRDDEQIKLSSIHQAKGLEYTVVFVIMLCDGLFPSHRSIDRPASLEEERRLFYVAVTRAKKELYLTYPLIRMTRGMTNDAMQQPSRFLEEIPASLLDEWSLKSPSYYG